MARTRCLSVKSSSAALPLKPPHRALGTLRPHCARLAQASPPDAAVPLPASVQITPPGVTPRTRLLPESAMNTLPPGKNAAPLGFESCAARAGPPSPENPAVPPHPPATVRTDFEVKLTSRTQLTPGSATTSAKAPAEASAGDPPEKVTFRGAPLNGS